MEDVLAEAVSHLVLVVTFKADESCREKETGEKGIKESKTCSVQNGLWALQQTAVGTVNRPERELHREASGDPPPPRGGALREPNPNPPTSGMRDVNCAQTVEKM